MLSKVLVILAVASAALVGANECPAGEECVTLAFRRGANCKGRVIEKFNATKTGCYDFPKRARSIRVVSIVPDSLDTMTLGDEKGCAGSIEQQTLEQFGCVERDIYNSFALNYKGD